MKNKFPYIDPITGESQTGQYFYLTEADWSEIAYIQVEIIKYYYVNVKTTGINVLYYLNTFDGEYEEEENSIEFYDDEEGLFSVDGGEKFKITRLDTSKGYKKDSATIRGVSYNGSTPVYTDIPLNSEVTVTRDMELQVTCQAEGGVRADVFVDGSAYSSRSNATVTLHGLDKDGLTQGKANNFSGCFVASVDAKKGTITLKVNDTTKEKYEIAYDVPAVDRSGWVEFYVEGVSQPYKSKVKINVK